jgi:hypothetical protein
LTLPLTGGSGFGHGGGPTGKSWDTSGAASGFTVEPPVGAVLPPVEVLSELGAPPVLVAPPPVAPAKPPVPVADAAGFPILPLLLRASEASAGEIRHALRFTIQSSSIRNQYVWPARHLTSNGTMSASLPPMGQLFRLKASYQIPSNYNTQSRAILQALKTYGMYIADGGSNMYIQGDPSAAWQDNTFSQVQSVGSSQFEAVDLSPIMNRAGFDPNSAAVPAP